MANPASLDLVYTRGDSAPMQFTLTDSDDVPIDISGFSFLLTVDPDPDPEDAANNLFVLTGTIIDGPAGEFEFVPTTVQSDQEPDNYFYDIQMVDATSAKQTICRGSFQLLQDITKT